MANLVRFETRSIWVSIAMVGQPSDNYGRHLNIGGFSVPLTSVSADEKKVLRASLLTFVIRGKPLISMKNLTIIQLIARLTTI